MEDDPRFRRLAQCGAAKKTLFGHFVPGGKREMRRMQFMGDIRDLQMLCASFSAHLVVGGACSLDL